MHSLRKFALPGILSLGILIRLIALNQSLWLDEATSALAAKMSLADLFTKFLPGDFHPPLHYLILKYWAAVFGYSEVFLRIPSVIFGIVTVYFVYLIAKKLFNQTTGLIASVLTATSGLAVYYSQEARMYAMAAMLVTVAVYLFINKKWLFFSLVLVLTGMTDYVSLFVVPIFIIAGWKDIRKVALSLTPLVAIFLLWSPIFIRQLSLGLSVQGSAWWNILGQPTVKNALLIPVKFILGRTSFGDKLVYGVIVAVIFSIFGYLLWRARRVTAFLWLWLLFPTALGIIVSLKVPTLSYFRFLFCLPAFYILTAAGIGNLGKNRQNFLYLIFIINLLSTFWYLLNPKFHREDWRAAAIAISTDKIVFPADSQKEALIYYGKGNQIAGVLSLGPGDGEVWLSRYVQEIVDPGDSARLKIESLGYNKAGEYNFNGVVFWKYIKTQYARRN